MHVQTLQKILKTPSAKNTRRRPKKHSAKCSKCCTRCRPLGERGHPRRWDLERPKHLRREVLASHATNRARGWGRRLDAPPRQQPVPLLHLLCCHRRIKTRRTGGAARAGGSGHPFGRWPPRPNGGSGAVVAGFGPYSPTQRGEEGETGKEGRGGVGGGWDGAGTGDAMRGGGRHWAGHRRRAGVEGGGQRQRGVGRRREGG